MIKFTIQTCNHKLPMVLFIIILFDAQIFHLFSVNSASNSILSLPDKTLIAIITTVLIGNQMAQTHLLHVQPKHRTNCFRDPCCYVSYLFFSGKWYCNTIWTLLGIFDTGYFLEETSFTVSKPSMDRDRKSIIQKHWWIYTDTSK